MSIVLDMINPCSNLDIINSWSSLDIMKKFRYRYLRSSLEVFHG